MVREENDLNKKNFDTSEKLKENFFKERGEHYTKKKHEKHEPQFGKTIIPDKTQDFIFTIIVIIAVLFLVVTVPLSAGVIFVVCVGAKALIRAFKG